MSAVAAPVRSRASAARTSSRRASGDWRALRQPASVGLAVAALGYRVYRARSSPRTRTCCRSTHRRPRQRALSNGEVLAVLSGCAARSLCGPISTLAQRLLASPWVRDAALRRSLPSTVEVSSRSGSRSASAASTASMYLVDERGVIIDQYGRSTPISICRSSTASPAPATAASMTDEPRAELAAR
jgi:hypothetical protein